tara:strand:+ start:1782 stop:2180 length:399 start_codon:yes stop_codon:yes gene_type:complete
MGEIINEGAFLPYPTSTLSPKITPNDLSTFKSRGISQVERELQLKLIDIREEYIKTIEHYNWNKLVYEAEINFEPVIGNIYHLYNLRNKRVLSIVDPNEAFFGNAHIASFKLNIDKQWELVEATICARELFT